MAAIEAHRDILVSAQPSVVLAAMTAVITSRRGKVMVHTDTRLEGRVGSQAAIRLLGGGLVKVERFPVVAAVSAMTRPDGTVVAIASREDLGIGTTVGMRKKYLRAVDLLADQLLAAVSALKVTA